MTTVKHTLCGIEFHQATEPLRLSNKVTVPAGFVDIQHLLDKDKNFRISRYKEIRREFLSTIAEEYKIPKHELIVTVRYMGTWVHELIAVNIAAQFNARIEVLAYKTFCFTGQGRLVPADPNDKEAEELVSMVKYEYDWLVYERDTHLKNAKNAVRGYEMLAKAYATLKSLLDYVISGGIDLKILPIIITDLYYHGLIAKIDEIWNFDVSGSDGEYSVDNHNRIPNAQGNKLYMVEEVPDLAKEIIFKYADRKVINEYLNSPLNHLGDPAAYVMLSLFPHTREAYEAQLKCLREMFEEDEGILEAQFELHMQELERQAIADGIITDPEWQMY